MCFFFYFFSRLDMQFQSFDQTHTSLHQTHPGADQHCRVPRSSSLHGAPHLDPRSLQSDATAGAERSSLGLPAGGRRHFCRRRGGLRPGPGADGHRRPASVSPEGLEGTLAAQHGGSGGLRNPLPSCDWLLVLPPQRLPVHTPRLQLFRRSQPGWAVQRRGRSGLLRPRLLGPGVTFILRCLFFPQDFFHRSDSAFL